MEKTLRVPNRMVKDGVIEQYAIGGAVAAIFYVEPINTNELVVFFHVKDSGPGLDVLRALYEYLSRLGYRPQGESIDIEGWPVQFLPIFNSLLEEAVEQAKEVRYQHTKTRVMTAEHLVAIMLQTGRLKDFARVTQFMEHEVVDHERLSAIVKSYGLTSAGQEFNRKYAK